MDPDGRVFEGKRVFVTGHTGFKGAWLCEWLLMLGAEVWGYSLPPPTQPSLFEQLGLAARLQDMRGDVRDGAALIQAMAAARPDFVFHLAAQSLVRPGYGAPVETFATNIMGTAHVLAAVQALRRSCVAVIVTSDKCYENHEQGRSYAESDALGGHDPYSASKAGAELIAQSWRKSFCAPEQVIARRVLPVAVATVRAGNVIGGGDWALNRIVPDCVRALTRNEPIQVRNPASVRPWQHVLEPLGGYLRLASRLAQALESRSPELVELCGAFNFGPRPEDHRSVADLVSEVLRHWPGRWEDASEQSALHEARRLQLSTAKAQCLFGWQPRWNFSETVAKTVQGYRASEVGSDWAREQIASFQAKGDA